MYLGLSPLWAVEAEDPGSGSISAAPMLYDLEGALPSWKLDFPASLSSGLEIMKRKLH